MATGRAGDGYKGGLEGSSLTERGKIRRESEVGSRARIHSCRQWKRYDSSWRRDRIQGEEPRGRRGCRDGGNRKRKGWVRSINKP